jgi:hypothetical protein
VLFCLNAVCLLSHSSGFNHAVSINCSTHHILCFDGCSRDLNIIEGIILGDAVQNSFASLVLHFVLMEQMCIKKIHYLSNVPLPAFKLAGTHCVLATAHNLPHGCRCIGLTPLAVWSIILRRQ